MTEVLSTNPRTGTAVHTGQRNTSPTEVDAIVRLARTAAVDLERGGRAWRAELLEAMAAGLETSRADIVSIADEETALGEARLNGELTRTCYQLRLFAEVLADGAYLEATIDHAGDTPMGPRPDLRRMLLPLGPVAVFGASNFPLAFSVPGGDTASALAAGCPVIAKVHESHPRTSELCANTLRAAAASVGALEGTISVVYGRSAGIHLVSHPDITAVGFTGSVATGRALLAALNTRPDSIPFYGELSGVNPLVVTEHAAEQRPAEIAAGLAGSYLLGGGQFCTKPGIAFLPATPAGDQLVEDLRGSVTPAEAPVLLNENIRSSFVDGSARLRNMPGTRVLAEGLAPEGTGFAVQPMLLGVEIGQLTDELTEECFGPLLVVARYRDTAELTSALARLAPSLTATIHTGIPEPGLPAEVLDALRDTAGRLIFNGFPTGVAVTWAQHHGGRWPSSNSLHTSVGPTAIRRFLRPFAWQDAPRWALPNELRDEEQDIVRRVDGTLHLPGSTMKENPGDQ
ncbi:NADP-dependent aldehyde dehydrogenase [Tamaricihabitans halophyticus]|uniref:NADP-dependent aldehyde dehydrogenase n=1 Tax=Tamaricihabitans halophyticus TaxID=1262583 RepID=A0A4R2QSL6_9PSEU|nr:aldehyde dehydrogenase (NADP(+)) [Tamaricihabitans halophyticus]TCP49985.1 NADP-dependent aldehyde dehydrogenase [Tamaricihabitans halophyticus]